MKKNITVTTKIKDLEYKIKKDYVKLLPIECPSNLA